MYSQKTCATFVEKPNKVKVPNNVEHPRAANARLSLCLRLRASGRAPAGGGGHVPCGQSACVVGARAHSLAHLPRRAGHKLEEWRRRVRGMAWLGSGARARLERESGLVGGSKIWARDFRRESAAVRGTGGAHTGGGTATMRACPSLRATITKRRNEEGLRPCTQKKLTAETDVWLWLAGHSGGEGPPWWRSFSRPPGRG